MAKRAWIPSARDLVSPALICEWKTAPTVDGLLDLLLDDAYTFLEGMDRKTGRAHQDGPLLLPRRGGPARLSLDLAGFSPEDLEVQLDGRKLRVTAKRESQSRAPDGCCAREYREATREVLLPEDADLEALSCALGADGQLRIQAPRRIQERVVPIRRVEEAVGQGEPSGGEAAGGKK